MQNKKIWLSSPHMGPAEFRYVKEAFDNNWIAPVGPAIEGFEKSLSNYVGVANVAALSSGTAAIHLALIILGVERGDEVISSTFTFAGTCNPIMYQGATPVFVDSERDTWNMDPDLLEEAINDRIRRGKKPKAIIPVHLYGMPAKIDRILEIAKQYEIPVIEDAAEGLGSTFQKQKLGSFGDIGIFSFNGNKIITTSGGGAMSSGNSQWITKAKFLATQARDPAPHYQHSHIGFNYRLSNVCAAIGIGQMEVLDDRVARRRSIFARYEDALRSYPAIHFQPELPGSFSNRWLTCITVDPTMTNVRTEDIRLALERQNIESRLLWKPMHLQPVYKDAPYYGSNVSASLFETGLCLPSGSNMPDDDQGRVIEHIEKSLNTL